MADFVRSKTTDLFRLEQEMQASERFGDQAIARVRASLAGKPEKLELLPILATHLYAAGELMARLDEADGGALSDYVEYNVQAGQLEALWKELGGLDTL
jgi:hypothetical protein